MSSTINIQLTNELRRYVVLRASDSDFYSTPSEYIRDLVRRDMEEWAIVSGVLQGLKEVRKGTFVQDTIIDVLQEE